MTELVQTELSTVSNGMYLWRCWVCENIII